ncbi:MAG: LamG-like jellyroll fold domain-containing protein, partial [Planctomycetota bacterium]
AGIVSWGTNTAGQKWVFWVQNADGLAGATRIEVNNGYVVGDVAVNDGEWHHVAVTWENDGTPNATDAILYVDGTPAGTSDTSGQSIDTASGDDVKIGVRGPHGNDREFDGPIDDVRIYDVALGAAEIDDIHQAGLTGPGTLQFSATGYAVVEGASGAATVTVKVTRKGGNGGAVSVDYATSDGAATAPEDYTAIPATTLSWADGDSSSRTFEVTVNGDYVVEADEGFTVALSNATGGATLGAPSSTTVTIRNDDNPGDLNGDGTVDQADVDIISANAGLRSSHAAWDPRCDPDGNDVCNLDDLMTVFRNWGNVY